MLWRRERNMETVGEAQVHPSLLRVLQLGQGIQQTEDSNGRKAYIFLQDSPDMGAFTRK